MHVNLRPADRLRLVRRVAETLDAEPFRTLLRLQPTRAISIHAHDLRSAYVVSRCVRNVYQVIDRSDLVHVWPRRPGPYHRGPDALMRGDEPCLAQFSQCLTNRVPADDETLL